jgi:hypothetical protein
MRDFLKRLRWVLLAFGGLALVGGGASIFGTPKHEVLYGGAPPLVSCVASNCIFMYQIAVGNTGSEPQENVRLKLRQAVLDAAILKPTIRNFGVVDRAVQARDEDGVRIYDLGLLKPRDRVELRFTLRGAPGTAIPAADDVLLGVEPAIGEALKGDPAGTSLGRIMWSIFGVSW